MVPILLRFYNNVVIKLWINLNSGNSRCCQFSVDDLYVTKMASAEQVGLNKTWELSLYELHRTPQDAITDNTEIAVSPRSLHSELMCPICLDMLKKTMTTKECLHRFCSDCIITALRSGNKVYIYIFIFVMILMFLFICFHSHSIRPRTSYVYVKFSCIQISECQRFM